ncbi:MAG: glycosyltransferase family 4 protein [Candidatus Diapherotrites archaeon]|nr:glycosyltransferase family 4 protein [Candidatus Diapherotrites archaeon]
MKVLHLAHHFWPCIGGMEKSLGQICSGLSKEGVDCKVVCLDRCAKSAEKLPHCDKRNSVEIVRLPFIDLGAYKIVFGALKQAKDCDIIHVHGLGFFSDLFLLAKFSHHKPVIIGSYGGVFHAGSNPLKWLYFYCWNRLLLRAADKVVVISGHDLELFKKIVPEKKIALVPVPVEIERFRPGKKEKNSFAFVGRLSKNKRVDLLIGAFSNAFKGKNARLYIAGEDFEGLQAGLERLAIERGIGKQVFFLGAASDRTIEGLLSKSEFFVSASEYESFGVSAIEAMASGCIPILSKIPSFEDFIGKGKNGFVVEFASPPKAAGALLRISCLGAKEKEEKRLNALSFSENFRAKKIAEMLSAAYADL